ncbi:MAG: serine/threonine-protein kinase [Dokdonella sp.]
MIEPHDSGQLSILSQADLDIARLGLAELAAPEAMLWDELDLDDPDDCRFGDYELLERIGRGGMGVVFRARQISLAREVALKFIVGGLAHKTSAVERFFAEARAAARLHHPNIVPVFEVGAIDGMHFFSMPLLRGQTLAERIVATPMTHADSVNLLLKLGAAVDYAHSLGLLHLDLKPANVLFDEHAQALIGDFGLARHVDADGGVDALEMSGTPAYMSPEQRSAGARLDARTDVYALGAILHELLSGVPPRAGDDAQAPPHGRIPSLRLRDRTIAYDLDAICLKCLRADPHQRYASVRELTADLARYRDGNSVSVRRQLWHERVWRNVRRHPALALATVLAFLSMLIGLASTGWQWQRAEHARAQADQEQRIASAQSERMRQLAGLMAAAFPAGDAARDERASSAKHAVAWLKQNLSGDAAAQRALLTSFRAALTAVNKADVVAALLAEIVDQLGEEYRQAQVVRLAQKGDRDSLVAAALIGIPRGIEGRSSEAHAAVLQRLVDAHADDPLALYVAALACHVQPQPCAHPDYYARLTAAFPDNAVHWVLWPKEAPLSDQALAELIRHAAQASRFDDYLGVYAGLLRTALRDEPAPASILLPMQAVVDEGEVAPSLRRDAVDSAPLPVFVDIVHACKPDSAAMREFPFLRNACGAFAEKGMRSADATILSRMISSAILRRLYKATPLEAEAKEYRRQYVWLSQFENKTPGAAEQLQQELAEFGEWEAWQRQADRAGAARTLPPGWVPANPVLLMLSEERPAVAPHH